MFMCSAPNPLWLTHFRSAEGQRKAGRSGFWGAWIPGAVRRGPVGSGRGVVEQDRRVVAAHPDRRFDRRSRLAGHRTGDQPAVAGRHGGGSGDQGLLVAQTRDRDLHRGGGGLTVPDEGLEREDPGGGGEERSEELTLGAVALTGAGPLRREVRAFFA